MTKLFGILWEAVQRPYWRWKYRKRVHAVRIAEIPEHLEPHDLYVLGECNPWAVVFACPCGCGSAIHLSLLHNDSPSWKLAIDRFNLPTLSPSVWRTRGCHSHFFLRQGAVVWCSEHP